MVFNRALFLELKTSSYYELVRIFGKDFTDRIRYWFVTPFKIAANQKSLKALRDVLDHYPHSSFKNLPPHELINQYLFSLAFSPEQRLETLTFQYKFLHHRLAFLQREIMIERGILCWEKNFENCCHSIALKISQKYESEGCLSLQYSVDDKDIYLIAFTICPGTHFGFDNRSVALVSRLQGTKGRHDEIANASKQLLDIFPASALMSALEGFCQSIGIDKIIGIAAKNQVSFIQKDYEQAKAQYDGFWKTFEAGIVEETGDYLIPVPFVFKPSSLIRSKFRKRTLAKRTMRRNISEIAQTNFNLVFQA